MRVVDHLVFLLHVWHHRARAMALRVVDHLACLRKRQKTLVRESLAVALLECLRPACWAILELEVGGQLACLLTESCREVSVGSAVQCLLHRE